MEPTRKQADIDVPAQGGEPSDTEPKAPVQRLGDEKLEDISPEDLALKTRLDEAVERLVGEDRPAAERAEAVHLISQEIRTATTTMTAVPKPLKFLLGHFDAIKASFERIPAGDFKLDVADVLAVLAITSGDGESRESLRFKLQGRATDLAPWGHEFVRNLAGELAKEYETRTTAEPAQDVVDLMDLVDVIVPFHLQHNAEAEAVDLLLEVQQLPKLLSSGQLDHQNARRASEYLLRCADFLADPDDVRQVMETAFQLYLRHDDCADALRVALRARNSEQLQQVFQACTDPAKRLQLAFVLGRHRAFNVRLEGAADAAHLHATIGNEKLSAFFRQLARDLEVTEAKTPDDIYKTHLADTGRVTRRGDDAPVAESARQNAASTYVNAFVNAGYGADKLITVTDESGRTEWVFKNKELGITSAVASLGMVHMWDVDDGFTALDRFGYAPDVHVRAGYALGLGLVHCGLSGSMDVLMPLLADHLTSTEPLLRRCAVMAAGIGSAGTESEDVLTSLLPALGMDTPLQTAATAALSLGLTFVGSCNDDVAMAILERLMSSSPTDLDQSPAKLLCLGLGLLFLGRQEDADGMVEAVKTIDHRISKFAEITVQSCAYAASGNVLQVQHMLHVCAEHFKEDQDAEHQLPAALGVALITMAEGLGADMAMRAMDHLLQYSELAVKRVVPLAIALLHVSHPDFAIIDTLSKHSHDADPQVAQNSILAMGLVGAGTNNSKIAGLLRQLSSFYASEADHLFLVRVAQGLLHMGKGVIGLNPVHSDRLLVSPASLGGLLIVLYSAFNLKTTLLGDHHLLLYYLAVAMHPRMLVTVDEAMKELSVNVRVGQAVDTVGQAGQPRRITGFQTHLTPVLLHARDRAELATEEFEPLTTVLEGVVLLRKTESNAAAGGAAADAAAGAGAAAK